MRTLGVIKKNWSKENFDSDKIIRSIYKNLEEHWKKELQESINIFKEVEKQINESEDIASEKIEDIVEKTLMKLWYFDEAKSYILYRDRKNKEEKKDIFKKRFNIKPYEYPQIDLFVEAIQHSYWLHTEFNYTSDIQDFELIKWNKDWEVMKKVLLMISQMENTVEYFWSDLYRKMPKPEIWAMWQTFAESEVRHMRAYSHLLEILWLNDEFEKIEEIEVIKERIDFLENIIWNNDFFDNKQYAQTIFTLSLFIENSSLLTLLMIVMSFNKYTQKFKWVSNVAEATSKEEIIHFNWAAAIIDILREEHPEWFDDKFKEKVHEICKHFYEKEEVVVNWIFENWNLEFISRDIVKEFIKYRINTSLERIWFDKLFEVNNNLLETTEWFEEELITTKHWDFFVKRSVNYNKRSQSMTWDDLF